MPLLSLEQSNVRAVYMSFTRQRESRDYHGVWSLTLYRVFLIPAIRNQGITQDTGNHLRETCGAGPPNWANVMDQQIPESLTVQQATPGRASGARGVILDSLWQMAAAGVAGVGIAVLS